MRGRFFAHSGLRFHPPSGPRNARAFSLLELLAVVAVVAAITAIAVPVYRGHLATARESALVGAMTTMSLFQEDVKLRTGAYGAGRYDAAAGETTLTDAIGWRPSTPDGTIYMVTADGGAHWTVTATSASGHRVCRVFPARKPCD